MKIIDPKLDIEQDDTGRVFFIGNAAIDIDGAPKAYGPNDTGLDFTANAGHPGNWFGIMTDNGRPDGNPITRVIDGRIYYRSDTKLHFRGSPIDASTVPGMVVPNSVVRGVSGVVMGCRGRVTRLSTGAQVDVVVFDQGPSENWDGEVTPPVADALGFDGSPRHGGLDARDLLYECWPGVPAVVQGITYDLQPA